MNSAVQAGRLPHQPAVDLRHRAVGNQRPADIDSELAGRARIQQPRVRIKTVDVKPARYIGQQSGTGPGQPMTLELHTNTTRMPLPAAAAVPGPVNVQGYKTGLAPNGPAFPQRSLNVAHVFQIGRASGRERV